MAKAGITAKPPKDTKKYKNGMQGDADQVTDPHATYARNATPGRAAKRPKSKGYDAKQYTGMLPGIAKRMKEYLKHVRDDR